ncbi:MAG: GAF domain-containing protein [Ktedonobacteraceae bacterium]|nr:GAF domain-containing protein [Ktedonobacteraceae bacterium]
MKTHETIWGSTWNFLRASTFTSRLLPRPLQHPAVGYLVAFLAQALAVIVMTLLVYWFSPFRFVAAPIMLVVLVVALCWGLGPALVATVVGASLPYFSLPMTRSEVVIGVCLWLAVGVIISLLASQTQRARLKGEIAQQDIKEAMQRASQLETIFETITDALLVYDTQGNVTLANQAASRLNVHCHGQQGGKDLLSQYQVRDCEGVLLPPERRPCQRVLQGETLTGTNAQEVQVPFPDERVVELSVTGAPIHDGYSQIKGATLLYRDVTERRRLERRIQTTLEALLEIADKLVNLPEETERDVGASNKGAQQLVELLSRILGCERVSIITIEQETQALYSLAVVGLPSEQEQLWQQKQPHNSLSELLQDTSIEAGLRSGEVLLLDFTQLPLRERPNPYGIQRMVLAPMKVGDRLIGMLALNHAGTTHFYTPGELVLFKAAAQLTALFIERERLLDERAQMQARGLSLRETPQHWNEFIGIAGHELRTPLTTMKASIEFAQRHLDRVKKYEVNLPPPVRDYFATLRSCLDRAERQANLQSLLISDLLDVSRLHGGYFKLRSERCDLPTLVREVVEDQRLLSPTRSILLELSVGEMMNVLVDANRMRQVISNYISNALKYSDADKQVVVRVERDDAHAYVLVHDQGPGLSEAEQQRIWERFYRVPDVQIKSGSSAGLGLGLYISRMIVEQLAGTTGVRSTLGEGSTFWFALPLQKKD